MWRDIALVSELIKSALEDREFLTSTTTQKLEVTQADKAEYEWIVSKVQPEAAQLAQII